MSEDRSLGSPTFIKKYMKKMHACACNMDLRRDMLQSEFRPKPWYYRVGCHNSQTRLRLVFIERMSNSIMGVQGIVQSGWLPTSQKEDDALFDQDNVRLHNDCVLHDVRQFPRPIRSPNLPPICIMGQDGTCSVGLPTTLAILHQQIQVVLNNISNMIFVTCKDIYI